MTLHLGANGLARGRKDLLVRAAERIFSLSATLVPPNFWTMIDMGFCLP